MSFLRVFLIVFLYSFSAWAQQERLYSFDLLAINYVTPIAANESPKKTFTAINSQDNSYHMFLQVDELKDMVTITMIDNKDGWYSYLNMNWSEFDQVDVTIALNRGSLSRLRTSKKYQFDFVPGGIRDTVIADRTFKTFGLKWVKRNRDLRYRFVIDTTFVNEKPELSEELFSSNMELLKAIPDGRFKSVLLYKDGDALRRTDNLDYVPISVKLVVK